MSQILNKNAFSKKVEDRIRNKKESYIDSIINTCEEYSIEPEDCKKYLKGDILNKLQAESIRNNLVMSDSASLENFS